MNAYWEREKTFNWHREKYNENSTSHLTLRTSSGLNYKPDLQRIPKETEIKPCLKENEENNEHLLHCQPKRFKKKGRILYKISDPIGYGSNETKVYKGKFNIREVAVKRISAACIHPDQIKRELKLMKKSDSHENVIKLYSYETRKNYVLIAMDLCICSVSDWIEKRGAGTFSQLFTISPTEILRQTTEGVKHLHSLRSAPIIHRDIKPANVLLHLDDASVVRVKISDFGISRRLPVDSTQMTTANGSGTLGWTAPEILGDASSQKKTFSTHSDIFSLGCFFYYVLTNGGHPFGPVNDRTYNITRGLNTLDKTELICIQFESALLLIKSMISKTTRSRPPAAAILKHHLFWTKNTKLQFLVDVSNFAEEAKLLIPKADLMFARSQIKKDGKEHEYDWILNLYKEVKLHLLTNKRRKYEGNSVMHLVRAIRNMQNHFWNLPQEVQKAVGRVPDEFMEYWLSRFPTLVDIIWLSFQKFKAYPYSKFDQYYCVDFNFRGKRFYLL